MDQPRLIYDNKEFGLRKTSSDTFEIKNPSLFKKVITSDYMPCKSRFWVDNPVSKLPVEKYHKIESFCFVTTNNIKREAALLLKSLRKFHSEPVYIFCDKLSKRFLANEGLIDENVFISIKTEQSQKQEIIDEHFHNHKSVVNDIHKPAEIFLKMDVMEWALSNHNNTFFLDSDIIVLDNLQEYFQKQVCLSPHYFPAGYKMNGFDHGFYNAGYVFCASRAFPRLWKHLYLNDSIFFEQECMNRIPEHVEIETFDNSHNVGFWRRNEMPKEIKSYHFHTTAGVNQNRPDNLIDLNDSVKSKGILHIKNNHKDIYAYYKKLILTNKIVFIHYGKSAGVYINQHLRKYFRNHLLYYSWHLSLNPLGVKDRDWTNQELMQISSEANDNSLLHQHHINWDINTVKEFKRNGWYMFTFLRRPEELLCSLYNWSKEKNINIGHPMPNSLNQCFEYAVSQPGMRNLWTAPDYIDIIDHVQEFSDDNFKMFLKENFDVDHIPSKKVNTSNNKGFKYYRESGEISEQNIQKLFNDDGYKKMLTYL